MARLPIFSEKLSFFSDSEINEQSEGFAQLPSVAQESCIPI
jgi:hypothetical protein